MATELHKAPCLNCEAGVMLKVNRSDRVYYDCNGNHDRKACGSRHVFGATDSENLINQFGNDNDDEGTTDPERESEDSTETGAGGDSGTGKDKSGGAGFF